MSRKARGEMESLARDRSPPRTCTGRVGTATRAELQPGIWSRPSQTWEELGVSFTAVSNLRPSWLTPGHPMIAAKNTHIPQTGLEKKEENFVLPLKMTDTIGSGFPNFVLGILVADSTITRSMALCMGCEPVSRKEAGSRWRCGQHRPARRLGRTWPRGGRAGAGWISAGCLPKAVKADTQTPGAPQRRGRHL